MELLKKVKNIRDPLLIANAAIEGSFGLAMITYPELIRTLVSVDIPYTLVRTCSPLAISVTIFSIYGAIYILTNLSNP